MAKVKFTLVPYPLQQEIIDAVRNSKYRFFPVAIGRQAGKSWMAKYLLIDSAANYDMNCMLISPSIPSARTHWNEITRLIRNSKMKGVSINVSAKEIAFPGGGYISIRSAIEPDNIRGGTLDLIILDEAAFFRKGEYVWFSVVLAMVTASGGKVLFTSTPNGRNWFYQIWKQGKREDEKYYKSFHATSYDSPYQDKELLDELSKSIPSHTWKEEYLAEFLADSGGVFAGSEAAGTVEPLQQPEPGHAYVAGIDFGFNHDASGFTVVDKYTRQQVYGHRFFAESPMDTIRTLVNLLKFWQPELTHLEKNGLGESYFGLLKAALNGEDEDLNELLDDPDLEVSEDAPADYVDEGTRRKRVFRTEWGGRVRAVHMDNKTKRQMVERLAADIEFKRLALLKPTQDSYGEIQLNEMSTYMRERTASGMEVTYNAAEGSMDDTVSTLYLAYAGVPKPPKWQKPWKKKDDEKPQRNPFRGGRSRLKNLRRGNKQDAFGD